MSVRKITIKSGNEEFTLDVTEEEYQNYYRPWWQQKSMNRGTDCKWENKKAGNCL